jgi:hypothetical protein
MYATPFQNHLRERDGARRRRSPPTGIARVLKEDESKSAIFASQRIVGPARDFFQNRTKVGLTAIAPL